MTTPAPHPADDWHWYVVHTHPNAEPRALSHVLRQGFEAYLPRYLRRRRHARRTDWVRAPLFPRYLFVRMNPQTCRWRALRATVGVSDLVCFGDHPTPVPQGVVDEIRHQEDDQGNVVLCQRAVLHKGTRVRVTTGALADQIGVFEALSDQHRVFLLLELLGRPLRVTMPLASLAPAT